MLFGIVNGYAGLIGGVTALYISAAESLNHGWSRIVLPTGACPDALVRQQRQK